MSTTIDLKIKAIKEYTGETVGTVGDLERKFWIKFLSDTSSEDISEIQQKISSLEAEVVTLNNTIESLETRVTDLENQNAPVEP